MDLSKYPLDLMLVPLSLFLTVGYHAYIWFNSNSKHPFTTIGITLIRRTAWLQDIVQDNDEKKGMLGVQSLRNALMSAILSASIAIVVNSFLAAMANNAYNSSHFLQNAVFGSQTGPMVVLKYASASLLLLFSFVCSSMAIGCIVEANFLISATGDFFEGHVQRVLQRGWVLAFVGNRVLYITLPFLLWLLGPVALALSSVVIVWVFYNLDFACRPSKPMLLSKTSCA